MNLAKDDFYCGAFLSYLVNGKAVPAGKENALRIKTNRIENTFI